MQKRNEEPAILIAGPTASGKSALAARLARRLGGRLINADAMQVYRDLAIVTARPDAAELAGLPHALYGTIDAAEAYSVTRWLATAADEMDAARAAGQVPIFVGGTGLYFKALTQGLSPIPDVPPAVRTQIRAWAAGRGAAELHAALAARDPATAARLRPTDPQRVLRALEVHAATGESLAALQGQRGAPSLPPDRTRSIWLRVDRGLLRTRIQARFAAMVRMGALDEVAALLARGLDPALPAMRAIGVPELAAHLHGELTLAAAIAAAATASTQYVKRQETFLRHQLPSFRPVDPDAAEDVLLAQSV